MGVSVQYVPRLTGYVQALRLYERTKPIRGTDRRPLARRRDHNTYSIRKKADGCIELVNYTTPVVTLEPPASDALDTTNSTNAPQFFRIKTGGWSSVTTRQFISQVLGIQTSNKGRYTVLHVRDGKYAISGSEEIVLSLDRNGWHVHNPAGRISYRINRKAANNVRSRYKKFADYLEGMLALRSEKRIHPHTDTEAQWVAFSCDELVNVFGARHSEIPVHAYLLPSPGSSATYLWPKQASKVVDVPGTDLLMQHGNKYYKERGTQLTEMMLSGDAVQMHKALVWLGVQDVNRPYVYEESTVLNRLTHKIRANFKEFLMRWHAAEVIEEFPTPLGQMPAEKYKSWVQGHKNT